MRSIIPAAAINQHVAILGKTGSGKTFAAKGIVEAQVLAPKHQLCVLDPTGAWYGLRLGRDGKTRGYDVIIIGGEHGDIPLAPRSGAAVARLVTEQLASVVIDTSGLLVGEYTRWFIDFAGTLFTTIRSPLHLVIDEAHHFMPQGKVPDPDTGKMLHSGNRLMSGGRSRGIRAMLITQRPAKLHKDSLSCADTLIAMRVMAPQDRAAIKDWIDGAADQKAGRDVLDSLANLKRGEGWVWYPEGSYLQRTAFPAITTYDSSATPDARTATPKLGEIDLATVKAALAEAVAEAEANDPKALKRRITELEKAALTKAAKSEPAVDIDHEVNRAVAARDEHWRRVVATQHGRLLTVQDRLRAITAAAQEATEAAATNRAELGAAEIVGTQQRPVKNPAPIPKAIPTGPAGPGLSRRSNTSTHAVAANGVAVSGGERKTLIAIAQHPRGVSREQLTILTGYKRSSRDTFLQRLRAAGLIETNGEITVTDAGMAALGSDFEPLPTGDALRAYWMDKLSGGERVVFDVVCRAYPDAVKRTDIDAQTDYQRSSRDTFLQRLSARRLVVNAGHGVRAAAELF